MLAGLINFNALPACGAVKSGAISSYYGIRKSSHRVYESDIIWFFSVFIRNIAKMLISISSGEAYTKAQGVQVLSRSLPKCIYLNLNVSTCKNYAITSE